MQGCFPLSILPVLSPVRKARERAQWRERIPELATLVVNIVLTIDRTNERARMDCEGSVSG